MPLPDFTDETEIGAFVGREPSWIVRSGISLIALTVVALLALAAFIRYPDVVHARVMLTTAEPPAELVSRIDGRIERLLVSDAEKVLDGQPLMLLESSVDYGQLRRLEERVAALDEALARGLVRDALVDPDGFDVRVFELGGLGELQLATNRLAGALAKYASFRRSPHRETEAAHVEVVRDRYQALQRQLSRKRESYERKLAMEQKLLDGSRELADEGLLAGSDLVSLESRLLDQKISLDDLQIQAEAYEIQLHELEHRLGMSRIQHDEELRQLSGEVRSRLRELTSAMGEWRQRYLFTSPVDGRVTLTRFWSAHQEVNRGEVVLIVAPEGGRRVGKLMVSQAGAGKIEPGQRVDVELDSYPAVEFGTLAATVSAMALVPDQNGYRVNVELPEDFVTTYDRRVTFTPNMEGSARIVTQDRRLLERLFDKVLYLLDSGGD